MSTLTADTLLPPAAGPGVTPSRVANAEWIKFRSLRSTWYSLGAAMVAAIGLGLLFSILRGNDVANHLGSPKGFGGPIEDWTLISLRGLFLAQLAVAVLGVLMVTGVWTWLMSSLGAVIGDFSISL